MYTSLLLAVANRDEPTGREGSLAEYWPWLRRVEAGASCSCGWRRWRGRAARARSGLAPHAADWVREAGRLSTEPAGGRRQVGPSPPLPPGFSTSPLFFLPLPSSLKTGHLGFFSVMEQLFAVDPTVVLDDVVEAVNDSARRRRESKTAVPHRAPPPRPTSHPSIPTPCPVFCLRAPRSCRRHGRGD